MTKSPFFVLGYKRMLAITFQVLMVAGPSAEVCEMSWHNQMMILHHCWSGICICLVCKLAIGLGLSLQRVRVRSRCMQAVAPLYMYLSFVKLYGAHLF